MCLTGQIRSGWNLRSEDSPIGSLSDEILELVRRSRFSSPTGPLIGCILLSLDLAFQEDLVRSDTLISCSSHVKIASPSDRRHIRRWSSWLRMVKFLVKGSGHSPAGHLLDGRIASMGLRQGFPSSKAWAS